MVKDVLQTVKAVLETNARKLAKESALSGADIAKAAKRAGAPKVAPKTINNVANPARHGVTVDSLAAFAAGTGVEVWQLLAPNLPDGVARARLRRIVEVFGGLAPEDQAAIFRNVENAAKDMPPAEQKHMEVLEERPVEPGISSAQLQRRPRRQGSNVR